jgi:hypothetical protein
MMPDQEDIRPVALTVSGKTLALITGGGLLLGALIVVGAIMPAEFNTDPLGIGKASGISRLWAPEEKDFAGSGALATSSDAPKQSHIVDIPLGAADWKEAAIEYKVAMKPGQSIFYKWTATNLDGSPATVPVETDQHGHDLPAEGQPQTVIDYRKARLLADQGSLTAPIDGIFGWYFRNHSPDPIMIRLEIEGFYTLVPPGQPGNEFSIRPFDPNAAELQEDQ